VVTRVSQNKNIPNSTPQLSILHVDCPITRLTMQSSHRVSLLLQQHLPAPAAVVFEGSDQTSAPPEQPAGSDALVVSCIARGSWGTCLPVTVAALEEEAMTPEEDTHVTDSLALLTALSVRSVAVCQPDFHLEFCRLCLTVLCTTCGFAPAG
jgi:hypothetical protein